MQAQTRLVQKYGYKHYVWHAFAKELVISMQRTAGIRYTHVYSVKQDRHNRVSSSLPYP